MSQFHPFTRRHVDTPPPPILYIRVVQPLPCFKFILIQALGRSPVLYFHTTDSCSHGVSSLSLSHTHTHTHTFIHTHTHTHGVAVGARSNTLCCDCVSWWLCCSASTGTVSVLRPPGRESRASVCGNREQVHLLLLLLHTDHHSSPPPSPPPPHHKYTVCGSF